MSDVTFDQLKADIDSENVERLLRPLWFSWDECCTNQNSLPEVNRLATAYLVIPPPGCGNLRETHLSLW